VEINRDSAAVVDHLDAAVLSKCHFDSVAIPSERFVDRVVDHLVDKVVEAALARGADIHTWALTYRFEAFKDCDR
jgi:hypothetical protein